MSFDEIVAELPKLTGPELQQIAEKAQFLAGLEEGLRQIEEGKLIAHEEVKAQFKSWTTGSSGRQEPSRIYAAFVISSRKTIPLPLNDLVKNSSSKQKPWRFSPERSDGSDVVQALVESYRPDLRETK